MPAPKKRPTRASSRSPVKPTVRRRTTRKPKDADAAEGTALENRSDDSHVDSVEVISPPAFLDPPPERRGRSRPADGRSGANVDDDIVFPEDKSAPAPRPPQAQPNDAAPVRYDDRQQGYYPQEGGGGYPNQNQEGGGAASDREGGPAGQQDDQLRRRRRRRRGRGNGEVNNNMPQGGQRDYGNPPPRANLPPRGNGQQQRGYGQRGGNGPQRGYGGGGQPQRGGYSQQPQRGYGQQRAYEPRGEFGQRGS